MSGEKRRLHTRGLSIDAKIALCTEKTPSGCMEWIGPRDKNGYGVIKINGKRTRAHRVSWAERNGPIPEGALILHHCDNPPCVNPDHLYSGDQFDNEDDKRQRGRGPAGEANVKAKLSNGEVLEIRRLAADGLSGAAIGRLFNVSKSTACRVIKNKLWKQK